MTTRVRWLTTLVLVLATVACGRSEPAPPTDADVGGVGAKDAPNPGTPADSPTFDFRLEDQPELVQSRELEAVPEETQKAIYRELKAGLKAATARVYASGLSVEQAVAAMDAAHSEVYYEAAKKHELTVAQLRKLNVSGQRSGWPAD